MDDKKAKSIQNEEIDRAIAQTVARLEKKNFIVKRPVFDVSSVNWDEFYDRWGKIAKQAKYRGDYLKGERTQLEEEKKFLAGYNSCGGEKYLTTEEVQSRLSNIDMSRFGKMLTGEFYDDATMNSMVCLSGSAYMASSSSLAPNERIKAWVRNLRRMGAESVSGYAMLGDAGYGNGEEGTAKSPFIVKALRNTDKSSELMHEVFIGLSATNHLRKFIPNFAYIYGFFECSPPLAGPLTDKDPTGKTIATFCNTRGEGNDTIQAVYENIAPARSFRDAIEKWNGKTFMQNYIAVLMALHKAGEIYKFTHYDMHDDNILMRKCLDTRFLETKQKNFYVPYNLKFSDGQIHRYYVASDGEIPVLIDYGRCHVEIKGNHYGMINSIGLNRDATFRDRFNPMYDAYKLLGFSLFSCLLHDNIDLFVEIAPLFRYFNTDGEETYTIMAMRDKTYFGLPFFSDLVDLEKYILFCVDYADAMGYKDAVTNKPPIGSFILLPVSERLDISVIERLGVNKMQLALPRPRTILEAYDVLSKQVEAYVYFLGQEDENQGNIIEANKYHHQVVVAIRSYRTIRDAFARPRDKGVSDLEQALIYERQRLSDIVYDFFMGLAGQSKATSMKANFIAGKNILPSINKKAFVVTLPSSIDLYFTQATLKLTKNYIGKIALFSELRQALTISLRGLNYMFTAYSIVSKDISDYSALVDKITSLYVYMYDLVDGFEDIYQEYKTMIKNFVNLFKGKRNEYMRKKDMDEDYEWYFNTATTLSSLLLEWASLREALALPK